MTQPKDIMKIRKQQSSSFLGYLKIVDITQFKIYALEHFLKFNVTLFQILTLYFWKIRK